MRTHGGKLAALVVALGLAFSLNWKSAQTDPESATDEKTQLPLTAEENTETFRRAAELQELQGKTDKEYRESCERTKQIEKETEIIIEKMRMMELNASFRKQPDSHPRTHT
jgi:cytoskeletal protein RodZ